jgi:hypothetical protein
MVKLLFAILLNWGLGFGNLKSFQSRLVVRNNTNEFLWSNMNTNLKCIEQDGVHLGLETLSIFS